MKVTLIHFTGKGALNESRAAAELLAFTKATRLNMTPSLMAEISAWPWARLMEELEYMAKTIKSSWEFIDLTFLIEGVTRATAQQITRTRTASYAMQSQRVTDARTMAVTNNLQPGTLQHALYESASNGARKRYSELVDAGVPMEEARGILPMNVQCNLVAKYNFRNLTELVKARKSLRAQGEYGLIVREMEACTLSAWPWAEPFFVSDKQVAINLLEDVVKRLGLTVGKGEGWDVAKAIDLIRAD